MTHLIVGRRGDMSGYEAMDDEVVQHEEVRTNSRIRAWWLTTFKGYRIRTVRRQPREGLFGAVRYECHWLLAAGRPHR